MDIIGIKGKGGESNDIFIGVILLKNGTPAADPLTHAMGSCIALSVKAILNIPYFFLMDMAVLVQ